MERTSIKNDSNVAKLFAQRSIYNPGGICQSPASLLYLAMSKVLQNRDRLIDQMPAEVIEQVIKKIKLENLVLLFKTIQELNPTKRVPLETYKWFYYVLSPDKRYFLMGKYFEANRFRTRIYDLISLKCVGEIEGKGYLTTDSKWFLTYDHDPIRGTNLYNFPSLEPIWSTHKCLNLSQFCCVVDVTGLLEFMPNYELNISPGILEGGQKTMVFGYQSLGIPVNFFNSSVFCNSLKQSSAHCLAFRGDQKCALISVYSEREPWGVGICDIVRQLVTVIYCYHLAPRTLDITPDGKSGISAYPDGSIVFHDLIHLHTEERNRVLRKSASDNDQNNNNQSSRDNTGDNQSVYQIVLRADGKYALAHCKDDTVYLIDTSTGSEAIISADVPVHMVCFNNAEDSIILLKDNEFWIYETKDLLKGLNVRHLLEFIELDKIADFKMPLEEKNRVRVKSLFDDINRESSLSITTRDAIISYLKEKLSSYS